MNIVVEIKYNNDLLLYYVEVNSSNDLKSAISIAENFNFDLLEALSYKVCNWKNYSDDNLFRSIKIRQLPIFIANINEMPCEQPIYDMQRDILELQCMIAQKCCDAYTAEHLLEIHENKQEIKCRSLLIERLPKQLSINKSWIVKPLIRARLPYP